MLVAPKFTNKVPESTVRYYRDKAVPWGPCGFVTYKRTYARLTDTGLTEDWWQTVQRGCNGILEIGGVYTEDDISEMYGYWFNLKGMPAGRPTWQLGTETVRRIGGDSLQNCFAGETEVITDEGVYAIRDILNRPVKVQVLTNEGLKWIETIFKSFGKQRLQRVTFADGSTVRATPDHEWMEMGRNGPILDKSRSINTQWLTDKRVPLQFMLPIATIQNEYEEGYAHGFTFGDGTEVDGYCRVEIFPAKTDMVDLLSGYGVLTSWCLDGVDTPVVYKLPRHWKEIPLNCSRSYALGFVLGLISADGNVRNTVRIHNKSREILLSVQRLARFAGLRCHKPYLDRAISPFDGSEKELWCITISTHNLTKDDFIRDDQAACLINTRQPLSVTAIKVEDCIGEEEVYCCQIPIWHNFTLANGVQTFNCWHVAVDHPVDPFTFAFNQLMLGGGVGFNVLPEHVYALPPVKYDCVIERVDTNDCDYIVTDNREGWIDLLKRVLEAFFYNGRNLRYNTLCIRDKGRLIKGFGGVASGPEDLVKGIDLIVGILRNAVGRKLRPTECMDIMNIIGMIVVAGNVRRSAEIAIGSPHDEEYMTAKDWSIKTVPRWRQQSNNTAQTSDTILLPDRFWKGYEAGGGEPYGLFNLDLCRRMGRLIDGEGYRPDPRVIGPNPCAEIILESHEACNLTEIFLPNIDDVHQFGRVANLLLRAAKAIGSLPFWHERTNEVVTRNNRIGQSVTGYLQSDFVNDAEAFDAVYEHLEETDRWLSREMRRNESIKLTTVKPSGTLSLLAGCTSGVHAAYSEHYIRRISFAESDPIVPIARQHGYIVEPKMNIDGSRDFNTMVVEFPVKVPKGTPCAKGYPAKTQLENQLFLQTHWADNSVSMTCYYTPEELDNVIKPWLREHYPHEVKTASFLRYEDHGFKQAPFEEITEAQYLELSSKCRPITAIHDDSKALELAESQECASGGCPIK